jgi:hypothetical protein
VLKRGFMSVFFPVYVLEVNAVVLTCPKCGREVHDEDAVYCPFCSNKLKIEVSKRTDFLTAGGVLLILAASICIIGGMAVLVIFVQSYQNPYYYGYRGSTYTPPYEYLFAAVVGFLSFVYGLTAGILTLNRRNLDHCLTGGSFTVFEGFLIVFAFAHQYLSSWIIGALFGVPIMIISGIALLFVSISKEEFK